MANKRLYRSETDKILGGVCGGIAEVYDLDPTLIRLALILFTLMGGSGLLAYILAWLIIPSESEIKNKKKVKDVQAEEIDED